MLNGDLKVDKNEQFARLDTQVFSRRNKTLPISICLTKRTNVCSSSKPDRCIIFLPGEHVIIKEDYLKIISIINHLKS